jgi:hypothetical protein
MTTKLQVLCSLMADFIRHFTVRKTVTGISQDVPLYPCTPVWSSITPASYFQTANTTSLLVTMHDGVSSYIATDVKQVLVEHF